MSNVPADAKRFHDLLARVVGCAACRFGHGRFNDFVSIHHVDGRTKPHAHYYVLPLCAGHHQTGEGEGQFIAVHPWKRRFEDAYGTQDELLERCVQLLVSAGHDVPAKALELVAPTS